MGGGLEHRRGGCHQLGSPMGPPWSVVPRRSLAVLLVALLAATACSSDDKEPATKPGISGTSQAKGDLVLDVVGADVVSASRERRPLDERARRLLLGAEALAAGRGGQAAVVREGPDGVVFYTMPDVVVNMQTADGRPTFLKLKLTLELPDECAV